MQSVQYWISACIAASSLHDYLIWRSCSSGRNFARAVSMFLHIQLLSDSTLRWTPLPSANDSYCQVRNGLSPPSYRPCRAPRKKDRTGGITPSFRSFLKPEKAPTLTPTLPSSLIFSFRCLLQAANQTGNAFSLCDSPIPFTVRTDSFNQSLFF